MLVTEDALHAVLFTGCCLVVCFLRKHKWGGLLCLSLRPEGNNIVVELCIKALKRCYKAYSFFLFFSFVGLLIGAAFNPLVFAEVMQLWQ